MTHCGSTAPPDYFSLFNLEPRFALLLDELDIAYRTLASQVHPDRFAAGTAAEQRRALELATHANEAYRALKTPLLRVIKEYPVSLLIGTGFSVLWAICVYTLIIFMPTYFQKTLHFESRQAFIASLVGNCFMVVACVFAGSWSDRIGKRKVLSFATCLMLVGIYPLLIWLSGSHTTLSLIFVQTAFCIMVALFVGVAPATLAQIFPTAVRSSGMSLSYNFSVTVFGGFAPAILTWLTLRAGGTFAPAFYVMAACLVSLTAIFFLPSDRDPSASGIAPGPEQGTYPRTVDNH